MVNLKDISHKNIILEKHQNIISDLENIQYLFVINKENGLNLFSYPFSKLDFNGNFISGFLTAIATFGNAIGHKFESVLSHPSRSTNFQVINYNYFQIVIFEGNRIRTALMLLNNPSEMLKSNIIQFNKRFEEINEDKLTNWQGLMPNTLETIQILEESLNIEYIYKYRFISNKIIPNKYQLSKDSNEMKMISEILNSDVKIFTFIDIFKKMKKYDLNELETLKIFNNIKEKNLLILYGPIAKQSINKIKHIINILTEDEKNILKQIEGGVNNYNNLKQISNFPMIIPLIHTLRKQSFITQENNLTERGQAIIDYIYFTNG